MENPEARTPPTVPWLFHALGLGALLVVTLVAAASEALEIALLAGCLLLVGLAARLWSAGALGRLRYVRHATPVRAFCGESLQFETSLTNAKPLPLPWVEVWERFPTELQPDGYLERSNVEPRFAWLCQGAALWPYQRARWRHTVECRHRGVFRLEPAQVRTGDPFGLIERQAVLPEPVTHEIVVYPRVVPLSRFALPPRHPTLDVPGARSLVRDPTRTIGLREYLPGDSQRLIHWPSTAHRGSLQVRLLEPTVALRTCLVIDVHAFHYAWALYRETLWEMALSAVASVAVYLHQQGQPVGLLASTDPPLDLPLSTSPGQLQTLLEALARLQPKRAVSYPLAPWLVDRLPRGSVVVLATSDLAENLPARIAELEAAGFHVLLLLAGKASLSALGMSDRFLFLTPGCNLQAVLEGRE